MIERVASGLVALLVCFACGGENPMGPSQQSFGGGAPAPAPAAAPPKAGAAAGAPVLYDSRDHGQLPAGVEREPKLTPETEKLVLSALSPAYKARRGDCQGAEDVLFHVAASASGAFTAPGTKQTAYVVTSAACTAPADAVEATHLVVVDGDKVALQVTGKAKTTAGESLPFYGTDIRAMADVDKDGASDLLVTAASVTEVGSEEVARLYSLAGGTAKRLRAFTGVYRDSCSSGGKAQAQVIHYVPGAKDATSQFSTEPYEASCNAGTAPKLADFKPLKPPTAAGTSAGPAPAAGASASPAAPASPAASGSPTP